MRSRSHHNRWWTPSVLMTSLSSSSRMGKGLKLITFTSGEISRTEVNWELLLTRFENFLAFVCLFVLLLVLLAASVLELGAAAEGTEGAGMLLMSCVISFCDFVFFTLIPLSCVLIKCNM